MSIISDTIGKDYLVFDGGFGSMLQKYGIKAGVQSFEMNILEPETVTAIHKEYLAAGSNVITLNTFGADNVLV